MDEKPSVWKVVSIFAPILFGVVVLVFITPHVGELMKAVIGAIIALFLSFTAFGGVFWYLRWTDYGERYLWGKRHPDETDASPRESKHE